MLKLARLSKCLPLSKDVDWLYWLTAVIIMHWTAAASLVWMQTTISPCWTMSPVGIYPEYTCSDLMLTWGFIDFAKRLHIKEEISGWPSDSVIHSCLCIFQYEPRLFVCEVFDMQPISQSMSRWATQAWGTLSSCHVSLMNSNAEGIVGDS